jgi:hypothetical protein
MLHARIWGTAVLWRTLVVILLGTGFAIAATAQGDESIADTRCVTVGWMMSKSSDQDVRAAAAMLVFYHIGRLEGRDLKLEIENRIVDELAKMTSADIQAEARRCGEMMKSTAQFMNQIGEHLIKLGF